MEKNEQQIDFAISAKFCNLKLNGFAFIFYLFLWFFLQKIWALRCQERLVIELYVVFFKERWFCSNQPVVVVFVFLFVWQKNFLFHQRPQFFGFRFYFQINEYRLFKRVKVRKIESLKKHRKLTTIVTVTRRQQTRVSILLHSTFLGFSRSLESSNFMTWFSSVGLFWTLTTF